MENEKRVYTAFNFEYLNGAIYIFSRDDKNGTAFVKKKNNSRKMTGDETKFAYDKFKDER